MTMVAIAFISLFALWGFHIGLLHSTTEVNECHIRLPAKSTGIFGSILHDFKINPIVRNLMIDLNIPQSSWNFG